MSDSRKEPRLNVQIEVELHVEGESASLKTRDLSNNGVYLEAAQQQLPDVGTIVYLKLKQNFQDGEAPLVKAQIVRSDSNGIALKFLED